MPFRYNLKPNSPDSHQVSAWWFAAIIRFEHIRTFDRATVVNVNDDSFNVSQAGLADKAAQERSPLLVTNQLVNWQVSHSKVSHLSQASFKVLPGAIDWSRQVQAGDWILFWAFDNKADHDRVLRDTVAILQSGEHDTKASKEAQQRGVNGFLDGLKFVGRCNAPKRERNVDPNSGRLTTHYNFTAVGFGEFDAKIYYNESFRARINDLVASPLAAIGTVASEIDQSIKDNVPMSTKAHQQLWLNVFLGAGPGASSKGFDAKGTLIEEDVDNGGLIASPNDAYLVPARIGKLLGIEKAGGKLHYVDILQTFVGVQGPSVNVSTDRLKILSTRGGFMDAAVGFSLEKVGDCSGTFRPQWVAFENTSTWELLSRYSNQPLNEMFTCLRVGADGRVRPTYCLRQNPLSSKKAAEALGSRFKITPFVDLPRWVVDDGLVEFEQVGPSDSLRYNFVSVQGVDVEGSTYAQRSMFQIVNSPPLADIADIRRSGVRSFVATTNADVSGVLTHEAAGQLGRAYNKFMGDILMDQALKWSGSIRMKGVQEPITIGDNLELGRIVYHIESVSHMGYVEGNSGRKVFTTTVQVSNGISTESDHAPDTVMPFEDPEHEEEAVDFEVRAGIGAEGEKNLSDEALALEAAARASAEAEAQALQQKKATENPLRQFTTQQQRNRIDR